MQNPRYLPPDVVGGGGDPSEGRRVLVGAVLLGVAANACSHFVLHVAFNLVIFPSLARSLPEPSIAPRTVLFLMLGLFWSLLEALVSSFLAGLVAALVTRDREREASLVTGVCVYALLVVGAVRSLWGSVDHSQWLFALATRALCIPTALAAGVLIVRRRARVKSREHLTTQ